MDELLEQAFKDVFWSGGFGILSKGEIDCGRREEPRGSIWANEPEI